MFIGMETRLKVAKFLFTFQTISNIFYFDGPHRGVSMYKEKYLHYNRVEKRKSFLYKISK